MKTFKDDFGNVATIEEKMTLPYKGSPIKEKAFILTLKAEYDNNMIYFVSIYETEKEALEKLTYFSCNTWKQIA